MIPGSSLVVVFGGTPLDRVAIGVPVITGPGKIRPPARVLHTGKSFQIGHQLFIESDTLRLVTIALVRQSERCGKHLLRSETGIDMQEIDETVQHQSSRDQQHASQARLAHDE